MKSDLVNLEGSDDKAWPQGERSGLAGQGVLPIFSMTGRFWLTSPPPLAMPGDDQY